MSKILAFDASNNTCSVAIIDGENRLAYIEELRPSMQAEMLIPMIEQALKVSKLWYPDLNYVVVTNGPGSFTGIRIGLACAKAISMATECVTTTISNFEVYHFRIKQQVSSYDIAIVVIDAYRNQLYVQSFNNQGISSDPLLLDQDDFRDYVLNFGCDNKIAIAGSGIKRIYHKVTDMDNIIVLPRFGRIRGYDVARCLNGNVANGCKIENVILPLYIRPPDAKKPL